MGSLDEPDEHNVVFRFPDGRRLYADRKFLRRESPYFSRMFDLGSGGSGKGDAAPPNPKKSSAFDDSDAEPDDDLIRGSASTSAEGKPSETTMNAISISDVSFLTLPVHYNLSGLYRVSFSL